MNNFRFIEEGFAIPVRRANFPSDSWKSSTFGKWRKNSGTKRVSFLSKETQQIITFMILRKGWHFAALLFSKVISSHYFEFRTNWFEIRLSVCYIFKTSPRNNWHSSLYILSRLYFMIIIYDVSLPVHPRTSAMQPYWHAERWKKAKSF